ncbi:MAG: PQQ-binding-like beta-propeller repeat protein [Bryobacteraceae bacterium]
MDAPHVVSPAPGSQLRLWPGILAVAVQWLLRFALPAAMPEAVPVAFIAGLAGGLAVLLWWAFFSRAPRFDRWGAVALMIAALAVTPAILHESIATGMMGMMFFLHAIPVLSLAFVVWAVTGAGLSPGPRRVSMAATILFACAGWALLRSGGITGAGATDFAWRWTPTPEQRFLTQVESRPPAAAHDVRPPAPSGAVPEAPSTLPSPTLAPRAPAPVPAPSLAPAPLALKPVDDWPGFRGPGRDGAISGLRIAADWSSHPPVELWRHPVGPGWSSFAVHGDLIYTQEQRGDDEVVVCYKAATGEPVWMHRDPVRFWESNAGAGPRATPTLSGGRVYAFGATGILNALDAGSGAVVWSRNAATDTGTAIPGWGFASSPLVFGDTVIVATAGQLSAYESATGSPRWTGPFKNGGSGYSSPHLATIAGVPQILLVKGSGAAGVAPADGTLLWEHRWPGDGIVQPALTPDGDVLVGTGSGMGAGAGVGVRRLALAHGPDGWTAHERWTSNRLKPYFNDFVVHAGHAYGFDGGLLACIGLEDGQRKWKGGRYGHGQLLLLREQGLLLVLSEEGELALVRADPGQFTELARIHAIEGKTWNHPVLAGNRLLVRNGEEMAAFRIPREGDAP